MPWIYSDKLEINSVSQSEDIVKLSEFGSFTGSINIGFSSLRVALQFAPSDVHKENTIILY